MLLEVYSNSCMSRTRVFEWHKWFVDGQLSVEDDAKPERPCSIKTDVNIKKVRELVCTDRRLTIRMMADQLGIDKELVRSILVDNLGMRKVCAKMVPRLLSEDQKTHQLHVCQDILQQLQTDATLLEKVITGDKLWIFEYDSETKCQSCQWKSPGSPRPKKAWMQKSQVKVMLITFFDHQGMVHHEYVPHDQTVNQHFYKEVLTQLMAKIWHKRRELWVSNTWILHHNNAPAHAALSVRQFLATKQVTILDHPPYSPHLAPCDYFLFPKLKGTIKGTHFEGVEDIKSNVTSFLKRITKEDFAKCFQVWRRQMEKCTEVQGDYFEGNSWCFMFKFLNKCFIKVVPLLFSHTSYIMVLGLKLKA